MSRKPWDLAFTAEPEEVAALRRIMRLHLGLWGLHDVTDDAQLCVSELVANVIAHVGPGTQATLAVRMNDTYLRIEVHDPDTRAIPALVDAGADSEAGRGMALVAALAARWGVELRPDRKVTWCELATEVASARPTEGPRLARALAEETAIRLVTDLLHWLCAHGRDVDAVLDRAQMRFEADLAATGATCAPVFRLRSR